MNKDIYQIVDYSIKQSKPDIALRKYLKDISFNNGRLFVIAVGKASWLMAKTASDLIDKKIDKGIVITKYNHSQGSIHGFEIYEAGHPVVDENSLIATRRVLEITKNLNNNDDIIFLLSGGASALFENVNVNLNYLQDINKKLLYSAATIEEINTIRKRLSNVKGGKFARHCYPAFIHNFILSDVISEKADSVGSGPTVNDSTTKQQVIEINKKYNLQLADDIINNSTVSNLDNVNSILIGSVKILANSLKEVCIRLGYKTEIVKDDINCNYQLLCEKLVALAFNNQNPNTKSAFIFTGEVTVEVKGNGTGGRNQHLALLCAEKIKDLNKTTILCVSSDGSDGPTDAAGGYVDNNTFNKALTLGLDINEYLDNYDSYNCLKNLNQLIITGPTNTNVNDFYLLLIQ
ncbi:MAG: glycerate kinase type-2 family protein [Erysipelotrichaceae bacterium]